MKTRFYFDPSCPFCWITSRWLLMVSQHRDLEIDWQPFSLALKNNELVGSDATPHAATHRQAHRVLRVMLAIHQQTDIPLIDLYTQFGIQFHVAGRQLDDETIAAILSDNNLAADLARAADDATYDEQLHAAIRDATAIAGDDIGVPTIIFPASDGSQSGFFGPVLQALPELDEALALWDGLSNLATNRSFYELKRARPRGGPDVASTARC